MPAEEVLIFDGLRGILTMVVNADATRDNAYEAALARLDDIEATLASAHAQFGSITLDPALGDLVIALSATEPGNRNTRAG